MDIKSPHQIILNDSSYSYIRHIGKIKHEFIIIIMFEGSKCIIDIFPVAYTILLYSQTSI